MIKAIFSIVQDPYSSDCKPGLNVYLRGEDKDYPMTYDEHWHAYIAEVPKGKYRLIVNDVWINTVPHYYLKGTYDYKIKDETGFDVAVRKAIAEHFAKPLPPLKST